MAIKNSNEYELKDLLITTNNSKTQISLASLIDNINNNNLHFFYQKEDNLSFISKLDQLNLSFYLETEKYLTNNHNHSSNTQKSIDILVVLLIQQINLYIEEIERLNLLFQDKKEDVIILNNNNNELKHKRGLSDDKSASIVTLNSTKKELEQRIAQLIKNEIRIKSENNALKRQNNQLMFNNIKSNDDNNSDAAGIYCNNNHSSCNNNNNNHSYHTNQGISGELNSYNTINSNVKISKPFNKKRHFSENNPYNNNQIINTTNDLIAIKAHNRLIIDNSYNNGSNVINSNSYSNSIDHYGNKTSNSHLPIKKKEFKIIKAVKEQLISGSKSKKIITSSTSPMKSKEEHKAEIFKLSNELKTIKIVEDFLYQMKLEVINEKKDNNNSDNIIEIMNCFTNNTINEDHNNNNTTKDIKIILSKSDDIKTSFPNDNGQYKYCYSTQEQNSFTSITPNSLCNGGNDKDKYKHQFIGFNPVTIDLNTPFVSDVENHKEKSEIICANKHQSIMNNFNNHSLNNKKK